jgi:putative flippase GtrA
LNGTGGVIKAVHITLSYLILFVLTGIISSVISSFVYPSDLKGYVFLTEAIALSVRLILLYVWNMKYEFAVQKQNT